MLSAARAIQSERAALIPTCSSHDAAPPHSGGHLVVLTPHTGPTRLGVHLKVVVRLDSGGQDILVTPGSCGYFW